LTPSHLNFDVDDIEQAVADLKKKGIAIETIDGMERDELGILCAAKLQALAQTWPSLKIQLATCWRL
jgi:hypothetical protein